MDVTQPITLEFLRRGPAHNQLLSPVTDYLALCGNHEPVTVHLDFEHRHVLERLRYLRYTVSDEEARASALRAMAEDMCRLLSQVPGMAGELDPGREPTLAHVRLVLSAAELALLPFEMSLSPPGCPGAGDSLLLQANAPLTLTREVRRLSGGGVRWPRQPRILVAIAAPPGVSAVPWREHLLELREAIDPWIMPHSERGARVRQVREILTVLPRASLEQIRAACAAQAYTHVHVLAHGGPVQDGIHKTYGLMLWDNTRTATDTVSGSRLADALRAHRDDCCSDISHPAIVTVASCDSGNQGEVITPGASLAHALHMADIPFVVASQYPLTKRGSIVMVRVLYQRLLWGDDPRIVLHDLRQQLHQLDPKRHDWASVVAYASFPPDLDDQLRATRSEQARRAMHFAMARADDEVRRPETRDIAHLRSALVVLDETLDCIPRTVDSGGSLIVSGVSGHTEELGLRGSVEKRKGNSYFVLAQRCKTQQAEAKSELEAKEKTLEEGEIRVLRDRIEERQACRAEALKKEEEALWNARRHYLDAFRREMGSAWAGVQYLALSTALDVEADEVTNLHWQIACYAAKLATKTVRADGGPQETPEPNRQQRAWGYASLVELTMLEAVGAFGGRTTRDARERVREYWDHFIRLAPPGSEEYVSTERQLQRYPEWWAERENISANRRRMLKDVARMVAELLLGSSPEGGGSPPEPVAGGPGGEGGEAKRARKRARKPGVGRRTEARHDLATPLVAPSVGSLTES